VRVDEEGGKGSKQWFEHGVIMNAKGGGLMVDDG
jgi:hypothetical protein